MKLQTYKLSDEKVFSFANGLWKGKKAPFTKVSVIRNTNFRNNGKIDYSNIANFDVETKQYEKRKLEYGDIIIERSGVGLHNPLVEFVSSTVKGKKISASVILQLGFALLTHASLILFLFITSY